MFKCKIRWFGRFYHQFTERISSLKEEDLIDLDYVINKVIRIMIKLVDF